MVDGPNIGAYLIIVGGLLIFGAVGSILIAVIHKQNRLKTVLRLWEVILMAEIFAVMLYMLIWAGYLGAELAVAAQEVIPF